MKWEIHAGLALIAVSLALQIFSTPRGFDGFVWLGRNIVYLAKIALGVVIIALGAGVFGWQEAKPVLLWILDPTPSSGGVRLLIAIGIAAFIAGPPIFKFIERVHARRRVEILPPNRSYINRGPDDVI